MAFKMSKIKMGIGKDKKKETPKPYDPQFEQQLKTLLKEDINRDNTSLPLSPLNSPINGQISFPLSPAKPFPSSTKTSPSNFNPDEDPIIDSGIISITQNQASLEKIEIENYYLNEQNRHFKRELLHCKLSVDALKKVAQTKDTLIAQLQLEKDSFEAKSKHLDKILTWFRNNASQALLESCPYSPQHRSTTSLNSNSTSDLELNSINGNENSRRSTDSVRSKKGKDRRRSDSYNFVRDLFKFTSKSSPKHSNNIQEKVSEEWLNYEEEVEDSGLAENQLLNLLPVTPEIPNKPTILIEETQAMNIDKKSGLIFSSLRGAPQVNNEEAYSPKSSHSVNSIHSLSPSTSPKDSNARAQLRNHLFSQLFNSDSPRALSPSSSSISLSLSGVQKEVDVTLDDALGDGLDLPDIDSELATLTPEDLDSEPYQSMSREERKILYSQVNESNFPDYAEPDSCISIDIDSELAALTPEDLVNENSINNNLNESFMGDNNASFNFNESREDRFLEKERNLVNGKGSILEDNESPININETLSPPILLLNGNGNIDQGGTKPEETVNKQLQGNGSTDSMISDEDVKTPQAILNAENEPKADSLVDRLKETEEVKDGNIINKSWQLSKESNITQPKPTISLPPPPSEPPEMIKIIPKASRRLKKSYKNGINDTEDDDRPLSSLINKEQLMKLRTTSFYPSEKKNSSIGLGKSDTRASNEKRRQSLPFPYTTDKYSTDPSNSNLYGKSSVPFTQSHIIIPAKKENNTSQVQSEIDDDMSANKVTDGFKKRSSIYKTHTAVATHIIKKNTPLRKKSNRQKNPNPNTDFDININSILPNEDKYKSKDHTDDHKIYNVNGEESRKLNLLDSLPLIQRT